MAHQQIWGGGYGRPLELPVVPYVGGGTLSKQALVNAVRVVVGATGTPLCAPDAKGVMVQKFHEHVLRGAGAQALARAGIELFLIQMFARWGSRTVLRYVQAEPLAHQRALAPRLAASVVASQAPPGEGGAAPHAAARGLEARLLALEQSVVRKPRYVTNELKQRVHLLTAVSGQFQGASCKAKCGWSCERPHAQLRLDLPEGLAKCDRCFLGIKGNTRPTPVPASSSSDSCTSASSSDDSAVSG